MKQQTTPSATPSTPSTSTPLADLPYSTLIKILNNTPEAKTKLTKSKKRRTKVNVIQTLAECGVCHDDGGFLTAQSSDVMTTEEECIRELERLMLEPSTPSTPIPSTPLRTTRPESDDLFMTPAIKAMQVEEEEIWDLLEQEDVERCLAVDVEEEVKVKAKKIKKSKKGVKKVRSSTVDDGADENAIPIATTTKQHQSPASAFLFSPQTLKTLNKKQDTPPKGMRAKDAGGGMFSPTSQANMEVLRELLEE
jgi:hypothetical protein